MRKAIAMLIVLSMGISLYGNDNASNKYGKDGAPEVRALPEYRAPNGRTEQYELYMEDSYGDGWNGASVNLSVNGAVVITGATVAVDDNGGEYNSELFDVDDFDYMSTEFFGGAYDSEIVYGIYDQQGYLLVQCEPGLPGNIATTVDYSGLNIFEPYL